MSEDLLSEFIFDARDHLATAGAQLLELEKTPGDLDSLNTLMGTLHTLKGNSGFMDLQNLYQLTHHAENLLQTIREKETDCPPPVIDLLLQVLDTAEAVMNRLENNEDDSVDWLGALHNALSEAEDRLEGDLTEEAGAEEAGAVAGSAEEDSPVLEAPGSMASEWDSSLALEVMPGAATRVALANGDLAREGDHFPARVESLFKAGGSGLMIDLTGLTSLTSRELKLIWAASRKNPERTAFLADPDGQPDLCRIFQVLGLDQRLNVFPDQASALTHLGSAA
jgi:two-component system chemotaxis sensor kinase CheA